MNQQSISRTTMYWLFTCISFVFGYSLGSFRCATGSFAWIQAWEEMHFNNLLVCNRTFAANTDLSNDRKRGRHDWHSFFEEYVFELIESTVELEQWGARNLTSLGSRQELHEQFRSILIKSLNPENPCNCQENETTRSTTPSEKGTTVEEEPLGAISAKLTEPCSNDPAQTDKATCPPPHRRIHDSLNHFSGIGRVNRIDFTSVIDSGVPLSLSNLAEKDVMILYGPPRTLPDEVTNTAEGAVFAGTDDVIPAEDAIKNCRQLSMIFLKNEDRANCWALVPGEESFHIQKWLRVNPTRDSRVNKTMPLHLVQRGYERHTGATYPLVPSMDKSKRHRLWLGEFLLHVDELLAEVMPTLERIAVNNKVVAMVTNAGQSRLLLNFACVAKSRGFDLSKVIVFVLDKESKDLVEGLGIAAYYNEQFFGALPSTDGVYGDDNFSMVVAAKVMVGYLLSLSGYDFLLQDVDIFWYKDPLTFFEDPNLANPEFDIYFQDDVNRNIRFQPWRANSGFYFARSNDRTRMLFKDFVTKTDHLMATNCDQQTLAEVLPEHVSLWGLRAKVFDSGDTNYFPGGGHFHVKRDFMKKLVAGELKNDVYIFHMNWNLNKKDKTAFMRQMGHWFVHDKCMDESPNGLSLGSTGGNNTTTIGDTCCSSEALFHCQFRDKPSIKPCHDSPAFENGNPSWW